MTAPDLPELRVLPDADALYAAAAEAIADTLAAAVAARGRADWATTGGSAAPPIYRHLAAEPLLGRVDWSRVHVWWGDDRFVPYDHPLSNALPLDAMLAGPAGDGAGIPLPAANVHRVPVPAALAAGTGPAGAADAYAADLLAAGPARDAAGTPVLDLVILGVGGDGHILSVFPGSAVWDAPGLCAAVPAPTHIEPHVERVTLHPRFVTAARAVMVISAGAGKAPAFGRAWTGDDVRELPVRLTRARHATWFLDAASAAELPR